MTSAAHPDPSDPNERSTFLQDVLKQDPVADTMLWAAAIPIAAIGGLWFRSIAAGFGIFIAAYGVLGIVYAIVARILGWRRMRWMAFIDNFVGLFTSW